MKKVFIASLLIATTIVGISAQQKEETRYITPKWDSIELAVTQPSSKSYYPYLLNRYNASDTTLTAQEYHLLYYGYPTQPGYRPLLNSSYRDSLKNAFAIRTSPTAADYRKIVKYSKGILNHEPFNMRDINALAFAYQMLGERDSAAMQLYKLNMLNSTIKATGSGLELESPWYITYMDHAEDILNLMNAEYSRAMLVSRDVEFVPVSNMPEKRQKGYYFNYGEVYKRKPDYLDQIPKEKRKLKINAPRRSSMGIGSDLIPKNN